MSSPIKSKPLVAILEESDREDPGLSRKGRRCRGSLVQAARRRGADADAVMYDDSLAEAAEKQLAASDAVLVFVDPVHSGSGRSVLNPMRARVAAAGTLASAHPAVIAKMGTKPMLVDTRSKAGPRATHSYTTTWSAFTGSFPRACPPPPAC